MNVADLVSVLLYGSMTVAMGALFLRAVAAPKLLRNCGAAYLAGQLLWLLWFLALGWGGVSMTVLVWGGGVVAVAVWVAIACKQWREIFSPTAIVLLLVAAVSFPQALYLVMRVPLIDWDARSIWFFHGKAIWVHDGITPGYFASPHFAWSHTDYPLLISVQAAVVAMLRGAWSEMAVKGFLGLNFLTYLCLLRAVLRERGWPTFEAWAVAVLVMCIALPRYLNGYADNHYAMPLLLAALLAFRPEAGSGGGALAGLLVAYALNIKNESATYVFAGLAFWGCVWWRRERRSGWMHLRQSVRSRFGLGMLLLGAAPFLLWGLFKMVHMIEGDLHLLSRLSDPIGSLGLCIQRAPMILQAMGIIHGRMFTPFLFGMVVALTGWGYLLARRERDDACELLTYEERSLWGVVFLVHVLIFTVYGLTPFDVWWHLGTSVDRLLLFPVLLLVGLLVCAAEKVLDYGKTLLSGPSGI